MKIDFTNEIGPIKPMHGVGQPPLYGFGNDCYFHYLTDAHIPYSRLHDTLGTYDFRVVDIPNIFRDFDADETDPASYDFTLTDWLIGALMKAGCEPVYRLGVSIENNAAMRAYRIFPPKDHAKWARICEHIIRHYNEGWADGFTYGIKYWEIWNEPEDGDESQMWFGTAQEYFDLYVTTAKHLKACFGDRIRVGGYASCGFYAEIGEKAPAWAMVGPRFSYFVEYFHNFLTHIKAEDAPFDFFSWHSYAQPEGTVAMAEYATKTLAEYGYGDVETHLNEWNTAPDPALRGTSFASATAAAMMLAMQNTKTDVLCYYDAAISVVDYAGLFDPLSRTPCCTYYAFRGFGELYALGTQVECVTDGAVYAIAATDGKRRAVMLANLGEDVKVETNLDASKFVVHLIDEAHFFTPTELNPMRFTLQKNGVAFLCDYTVEGICD